MFSALLSSHQSLDYTCSVTCVYIISTLKGSILSLCFLLLGSPFFSEFGSNLDRTDSVRINHNLSEGAEQSFADITLRSCLSPHGLPRFGDSFGVVLGTESTQCILEILHILHTAFQSKGIVERSDSLVDCVIHVTCSLECLLIGSRKSAEFGLCAVLVLSHQYPLCASVDNPLVKLILQCSALVIQLEQTVSVCRSPVYGFTQILVAVDGVVDGLESLLSLQFDLCIPERLEHVVSYKVAECGSVANCIVGLVSHSCTTFLPLWAI